jgi:hypothetical protein
VLRINKAWVLSLAFGLLWALGASLSDAYTPAGSALVQAKTVVPCESHSGPLDAQALGDKLLSEPEEGNSAHVEFAKSLKSSLLAERSAEISFASEIHSPELATPLANIFSYLSTPVLLL